MRYSSSFKAATFASTAALAGLSTAQELPSAIAGCAEVGCPNPIEDSVENVCTLQNRTFGDVGVSNFGHNVADLTWVQGSSLTESDGRATVTSSFYLGTPFEYDSGNVRACAAFFHQAIAAFQGDVDTARGACDRADVSMDCITALIARVNALNVTEQDDACQMLEDDLRENLDSACVRVAGGDHWRDVSVRPILGSGAPEAIISSDNLTSNCWPIRPKEHDLAFVESYEETTNDLTEDGTNALFYGITPILTVFYDWSVNTSPPRTSFTMSCLKAVNSSVAANELLEDEDDDDDDDDDDDEGAATIINRSGTAAAIAAMVAALGPLLL